MEGTQGEKLVQAGGALVRLENMEQMQVSLQRPRDERKILKSALDELELYPSMASEVIYVKPVGKDETGKMQFARGLSIRAAESLANRWANSAYGCDILAEDDESATIAAVFLDYETNTRHVIQARVSKLYKTRTGQVVRHTPDRFDLVLKANQSKILREVINRSLPAGLKKEYEMKAEQLLKTDKLSTQRSAVLARFEELAISENEVVEYKGKPVKDWKRDDIVELLGIANAIKDGEISADVVKKREEKKDAPVTPDLKIKTQGGGENK